LCRIHLNWSIFFFYDKKVHDKYFYNKVVIFVMYPGILFYSTCWSWLNKCCQYGFYGFLLIRNTRVFDGEEVTSHLHITLLWKNTYTTGTIIFILYRFFLCLNWLKPRSIIPIWPFERLVDVHNNPIMLLLYCSYTRQTPVYARYYLIRYSISSWLCDMWHVLFNGSPGV